jgi:hypothetical protein
VTSSSLDTSKDPKFSFLPKCLMTAFEVLNCLELSTIAGGFVLAYHVATKSYWKKGEKLFPSDV